MNRKIYYILLLLLFAITYLSAQTDSLLVVSDSLLLIQTNEDSLFIDSVMDSAEKPKVQVDYSAYENLFARAEEYKTKSRSNFMRDGNKELFWSIQGHLFGLSSDNYFLKRDNFTDLPSLYPTSLKLQNYNRFYTESVNGDFYNLTKEYYLLPVTAIEVVASTGDYDLATGFVAVKKNKFLNRYNLDFRMNFVKGDLYSGSELASNSSANLLIPFKNSQLNIGFNSISYEGPYYRLSPAFRLNTTIFEETSQALSLFYDNNYLNVGLKFAQENYKRITPSSLNREYWQILLTKDFSLEQWQGKVTYEYFIHEEDFYNQELNSLSSDIDQLLSLDFSSDYDRLNLTNNLVVTYPYQLLSNSTLGYKLTNHWQVGAFTNFRKTLKKEKLFTDYSPNSVDSIVDSPFYLNEKNNTGLKLDYSLNNLNLALEVGNATIEAKLFNSNFDQDYQALKTQFSGNFSHTYGKYQLNLNSLMRFYQELDGYDLHYTPKANFTNSLEISHDMNYDNFIKAGIAHHYFDAYLAFQNKDEVLDPAASLLDLYLGFQITKQFEINGYWKNILDNQVIAGQRTIPQSITVLISWNFLN